MASPRSGNPVGFRHVQIFQVGTDGRMYGTIGKDAAETANGVSQDTQVTMTPYYSNKPKVLGLPNLTPTVLALTGGDRLYNQVQFGANDLGTTDFQIADYDATLHALAGGSTVDETTNDEWVRATNNELATTRPQLGAIFSTPFMSTESGSDGAEYWINYILPRFQASPGWGALGYQAGNDTPIPLTMNSSEYEPHGLAYANTAIGATDDKVLLSVIITPKPLTILASLMDGTATTVVGTKKPLKSTVTLNGNANEMALNGTLTALSSVTIGTSTYTLASAGSGGDYVGILSETAFVAQA